MKKEYSRFLPSAIILGVLALGFAYLLYCLYCVHYKAPIINTSLAAYTDGEYRAFTGGSSASAFFSAQNADEGEVVGYAYFDCTNKNSPLHRFYTVHALDVAYSAEAYAQKKAEFKATKAPGVEQEGAYALFELPAPQADGICAVATNDTRQIVRYLFIDKAKREDNPSISNLLHWNTALDWDDTIDRCE